MALGVRSLVKKLKPIQEKIEKKKGEFTLFALFEREEAPYNHWDLVAAAPWLDKNRVKGRRVISNILRDDLGIAELMMLSKVVIMVKKNSVLDMIKQDIVASGDSWQFIGTDINGMKIERSVIMKYKGKIT